MKEAGDADVIVKAAAVGDYRAKEISPRKLKRGEPGGLTLELVQNPDIARAIGERKKPGQILVGFAAETENIAENALEKIEAKNLDIVVANDITEEGAGFESDTNSIEIFFAPRAGLAPRKFSGSKWEAASVILDQAAILTRAK
jgi:phosphopantothenoylcysteine decarboxylase/phosphopantothenate--cysteine ligase